MKNEIEKMDYQLEDVKTRVSWPQIFTETGRLYRKNDIQKIIVLRNLKSALEKYCEMKNWEFKKTQSAHNLLEIIDKELIDLGYYGMNHNE